MTRLSFQRLTTDLDPRFAALLLLYAEAFPPEERKPAAQLRSMLRQPRYRFFVAEQRSTQSQTAPPQTTQLQTAQPQTSVVGMAVLACAESAQIALLEYLAVAPEARGRGIGRWLFEQVLLAAGTAKRPLLIEAESDRDATPGQAERRRRKRFYRALGAREITGLRYLMPSVSTGTPPPMELLLHTEPPPATVPKAELRRWLQALYTEIYGQSPEDPRLRDMLERLPARVSISQSVFPQP